MMALAAVNATAATETIPLRVLTYNIWGLPKPTEHAPWRYAEIARRLDPYDVVAFEETWSKKTDVVLPPKTHPYHAFGGKPHGLIGGSGLMAISRYPITESHFRAYKDCSEWECPASKGVLMFRVQVRFGVEIDFYATHLNAWESESLVRSSQILELVGMVHDHSDFSRPIVVLGDFNSDFRSINYWELVGNLSLRDSYEEHLARVPDPTPEQRLGYTFDVQQNPWAAPALSHEDHSQRLDYVFFRDTGSIRLRVNDAALVMQEPVRDGMPLSDHYALTTLFSISLE